LISHATALKQAVEGLRIEGGEGESKQRALKVSNCLKSRQLISGAAK
jgi:hypothetical protein